MPHQCTNCGRTFADGSKEMLSGCPGCGGNKFQYLPAGALDEDLQVGEPPSRPGDDSSVADAVGRAATTVRDYVSRRQTENDAVESRPQPPSETAEPAGAAAETSVDRIDEGDATGDEPTDEPRSPPEAPVDDTARDAEVERGGGAARSSEDTAQASARSDMVGSDDLPKGPLSAGSAPPAVDEPNADDPTIPADPSAPDRSPARPPSEGRVIKEPDSPNRPNLEELRKELNDQFESIKILNPGQYELNLMELYDREEHIIALQEDGRYVIEVPDSWRKGEDE